MGKIRHFFRRAKRKILRETIRALQVCYQSEIYREASASKDIRLNIGAGDWHCKGWINLDYPTQWYAKMQSKHPFVPYDIRSESIPFEANTVKAVYCSHVIEHIEDQYIKAFFADVYRVLTPGGVFRIACPDAEFLYNVSKFDNEYWYWSREWFASPKFYTKNPDDVTQVEHLVRETATPCIDGYVHAIPKEFHEQFSSMGMEEFLRYVTSGLEYRKDVPGDHINYWTFDKVKTALESAGFPVVIRSKYAGSMCKAMCILGKFDITHPEMSLYVEAVK